MAILEGETALITGGGSGIGRAIAQRFHDEGAFVIVCGRNDEKLGAASASIATGGDGVVSVPADVTRKADRARIRARVGSVGRGLDILVNCAGMMRFAPLETTSEEMMQDLFAVNSFAPWRLAVELLPYLKESNNASIVNIASIDGMRPFAGSGAYCMSKASLITMSQVMALEWASRKIRVNCISPGMVEETELGNAIFSPEQITASYDRFRPLHPIGRNGKPRDVAEAALFLASPASDWITGAVLPLDGGRHLTTNEPE